MKSSAFLKPPAWFSIRSPEQEDAYDAIVRGQEKAEDIQTKGFAEARAAALPMMAEIVRDMDSRTEATVRGGIRTWSPQAYARVMARKRKEDRRRKWMNLLFAFFHCRYEHS